MMVRWYQIHPLPLLSMGYFCQRRFLAGPGQGQRKLLELQRVRYPRHPLVVLVVVDPQHAI